MHNYILLFAEKYLIYNWQVKKKKKERNTLKIYRMEKNIIIIVVNISYFWPIF